MTTVNVYLTFNGNCLEAFNFYKSVFGGEFPYVGYYKDIQRKADAEVEKHSSIDLVKDSQKGRLLSCKKAKTQTPYSVRGPASVVPCGQLLTPCLPNKRLPCTHKSINFGSMTFDVVSHIFFNLIFPKEP
ncbi:MAG: hypothetical protein Q8S54_17265 [Bacteroidota bacterium]|nr:hypothetical protein [Bacteroidota bacterium]